MLPADPTVGLLSIGKYRMECTVDAEKVADPLKHLWMKIEEIAIFKHVLVHARRLPEERFLFQFRKGPTLSKPGECSQGWTDKVAIILCKLRGHAFGPLRYLAHATSKLR